MTRPFRFGLTLERTSNQDQIAEQARRAEESGYSCMVMTDHLDARNGPLVTITAAALATSTLRVGTLVLCNDYRHPVVLSKELATLDRISDGRLEIGIGAGWMTTDYEQAGLPKDRPGVRIERLAEAVTVMEGCFGDGPFDFAGEYYTISGLDAGPTPVQRPRPPLLMAGGGPRMLTLAAQRADIVAVNVNLRSGVMSESVAANATAEATDEKVALVRDVAGDRFDAIELSVGVFIANIVDDPPRLRRRSGARLRDHRRAGPRVAPRPLRHGRGVHRRPRGAPRALGHLLRHHPRRGGGGFRPRRRTPRRPVAPESPQRNGVRYCQTVSRRRDAC